MLILNNYLENKNGPLLTKNKKSENHSNSIERINLYKSIETYKTCNNKTKDKKITAYDIISHLNRKS